MSQLNTAEQNIKNALEKAKKWYEDTEKYKDIKDLYDRGIKSVHKQYDIVVGFSRTILDTLK